MRLVITGGLGHIGTGLLSKIDKLNGVKEILIIDNLSSNKLHVLFDFKSRIPIKFIESDLLSSNLTKILKTKDIIIHLAAITNAAESFKIKKKIFDNNFLTTKKIVDIANKKKLKCIFFSSTSVYGSGDSIMYEDDKKNLNPQSPYADCKIKEENYILDACKKKKLQTIILRLGTIFGPSRGMRFHTAVNKFCYQAAFDRPLTIWKTAYNQKRPYLDLNDAIKCIHFIIKKDLFNNEVYNVATENISIKNLLKNIKKYKKIKIKFVFNKIMNQLSYKANCEKIIKLGFKFSGNLDQQIKNTLRLFSGINK
jgi:UDP-glucose 4-epimerase